MKYSLLLWIVLLAPSAFAASGHITLLALVESGTNTTGATADLSLEIKDGSGRVFLDTFPLTKIATQISMRFAQQIACEELQVDCSGKDFFYTIKASPGILGGPSAGAAAAVLTASLLEGTQPREDFAMTGTINSGGLIGPVGGLKEKIAAAGAAGIKKVLIPFGSITLKEDNRTTDLAAWGQENNVAVSEVQSLDGALFDFTGIRIQREDGELVIKKDYAEKMEKVAQDICNRGKRVFAGIDASNETRKEYAVNLSMQGDELISRQSFYAAASYCFRSNIVAKTVAYKDFSLSGVLKHGAELADELNNLQHYVDNRPLTTIAELETYLAVNERLTETRESLHRLTELVNDTQGAVSQLAYTEERLESAKSWSAFYDLPSQALQINNETLASSCQQKIAEAEERISYVQSFIPNALQDTRKTIDRAYSQFEKKNFADCLHNAAKAKAEADIVLSAVGFEEPELKQVLQLKLDTVKRNLIQKQKAGLFPLVGYSYYEYSKSLAQDDLYSALLFAEYSLELSNIDIYFKQAQLKPAVVQKQTGADVGLLLLGVGLGLLLSWKLFGRKK